jgi:hypothetical protein
MGWTAHDLTQQTGSPPAIFGLAGFVFQGQKHVFFNGFTSGATEDGRIHELFGSGLTWNRNDLMSAARGGPLPATGAPKAYAYNSQGTQHVLYNGFAQGPDFHVHELHWDDNGWFHADLTNQTHSPIAFDFAGYEFNGVQFIVYRGEDNHIHELQWLMVGSSGEWVHDDLTNATGAPPPARGPNGYGFEAQGTRHVIYMGIDGHINELWRGNTGWQHNDLTLAGAAPILASDEPTGYAFEAQFTQHVNYQGTDGHIHELKWDTDGWHHTDLTGVTGAPPSVSNIPAGYVFVTEGTLHVDYLGTDEHIHELWWSNSGWHHNDLTIAATAPLGISNATAYFFAAERTQHVFYISGADHHVVELRWTV